MDCALPAGFLSVFEAPKVAPRTCVVTGLFSSLPEAGDLLPVQLERVLVPAGAVPDERLQIHRRLPSAKPVKECAYEPRHTRCPENDGFNSH